jgi:glycosyltransferase involved in cell wall biosynthesis
MRFHLPALPGQPITKDNSTCAFTQKIRKFADMMVPRGHEVFIYGMGPCDANATEFIDCYPQEEPPLFHKEDWVAHNLSACKEIAERKQPDDFIGLMAGQCSQLVADTIPDLLSCEYGIGYAGVGNGFKVFESYAWMHTVYGQLKGTDQADGDFYDAVIPAYFEVPDTIPSHSNDYLLFVGRVTARKGIQIAEDTAARLDMPLLIAGEGDYEIRYGEQVGVLKPRERDILMAGAKAVFAPTIYIEPFGCVAVEAMLNGTPAITTDWGAFTETVEHGVTGFRCRTLAEFCEAVENTETLNPYNIRQHAIEKYTYEPIAQQYERYFNNLAGLRGEGWYS